MKQPAIPKYEKERLDVLNSYDILDSLPEQSFDDLTLIASQICNTPIALISLIDEERQWFKSKFGLETNETSRNISFCGHAINEPNKTFKVENAKTDPRFSDNPLVTGELNIGFYAGVPLVDSSNMAIGTLCVIDQKPKKLTENQTKALEALARQVMDKIQERKKNQLLITDINSKNNELANTNSKYASLYHEAPDMMISFEPNSKKIIECNNTISKITGYTIEEIKNNDIFHLFHPDSKNQVKLVAKEFIKNEIIKDKRLLIKTKSGKKINVSLNIRAVKNKKGKIINYSSILRIIDDLVIAENKLIELNNNLELTVKKRTSELNFNKKRLELILEGTKDSFLDWVDIKTDKLWWSSRFLKMLGYQKEEVNYSMAFFMSRLHPEDFQKTSEYIQECIDKNIQFDLEFRLKTKKGNYKWVRGRGSTSKDLNNITYRFTGSITNIDDRKALEIELQKTKDFLEKVTTIAPSIIYVFDQQTMSNEYSNREIGNVLGYNSKEIKEMGSEMMTKLCHPSDLNLVFEHFNNIKKLKNNENASIEYRMMHKDGNFIHLLSEDTVFERDNKGAVIKHLGVATDISSVKKGLIKIAKQSEMLKIQNESLKQFAYVAMHDLKSPMLTLEGHFEYLKTKFSTPSLEIIESIQFIEEEIRNFNNSINELNKAIKVREIEVKPVIIDFNLIIHDLLNSYKNKIEQVDGELNLELTLESKVVGTIIYLKSIITNLLSNALKYSSPKRTISIFIKTTIDDNYFYLTIEDNGLGIDLNLQKNKIFKMFNQFHQQSEGNGMGLYMVKSMIEKLGGTIKVESEVDKGTKFTIRLKRNNEEV